MTFRYLLAATLLAGGVLAAGTAARADTFNFIGYDNTNTSQVDVSGSFSYDSSKQGTTIGFADLTAFNIHFLSGESFGLSFVQKQQPTSVFSFDTVHRDLLPDSGALLEAETDDPTDGFDIEDTAIHSTLVYNGSGNGYDALYSLSSFNLTPAPEPPAIAVFGLALFGLMLVRGRGGRSREV